MKSKKMRPAKALVCALAFSSLVHTVGIYPKSLDYASRPFRAVASALYESYQSYKINKERRALLSIAREQTKAGRLNLGWFMLAANDIDAREAGEKPDLEKATKQNKAYKAALAKEIHSGRKVQEAFPKVLKDMKYYGIPSGRMIDALLDQGGSCEQISHLSVSLLNDLGYRKQAFLRVYGANADGMGHVAPILTENRKEYDIVAGGISDGKGTLVPASYLVEAYAKAHGLPFEEFQDKSAPGKRGTKTSVARSGQELALPDGKPSGFAYPKAKDSYGGSAPLFSSMAFKSFSEKKAVSGQESTSTAGTEKKPKKYIRDDPWPNNYLGVRSVASAALDMKDDHPGFPIAELPSEDKISQISGLIEHGKRTLKEKMDDWQLTARYATLCGLYRELEWNLRLLGMDKLAEAAYKQRKKVIELAKGPLSRFIGNNVFKPGMKEGWDHPGYLVYLGKEGEDALIRSLEKFSRPQWMYWGGISYHAETIAYLIAASADRNEVLKALNRLSSEDKVRVLDTLEAMDPEGDEDPLKAFRIYSSITRNSTSDTKEKHAMMEGIINQGEGLMMDNLTIRLDEVINSKVGEGKIAIISILGSDKKIVTRKKLREGETISFHRKDRPAFELKAASITPGYTFKTNTADLKVYSSASETFEALEASVRLGSAFSNIRKEWEEVILVASAMRLIFAPLHEGYTRLNPNFSKAFYQWLGDKKEFEWTRQQVKNLLGPSIE